MPAAETTRWARVLPISGWLPHYHRADLRFDVIAGITVAALAVPKSLGYAAIAGVPVENGLYAAAAGSIVYAIFGTSRQISTAPSSALAAIAAGAVAVAGVASGPPTAELVAAIAIAAGILFLLATVLRMGWISQFLSQAVITGFLFGAAIDVVIGELPRLTGTDADGKNSWRQLGAWIQTLDEVHRTSLVIGIVGLAVIVTLHLSMPKVPGALVLVIGGLIASKLLDLSGRGVATVGDVPRGVPSPTLPSGELVRDNLATIGVAAAALFLIGFSQTAGDARLFAARHRYRICVDGEMVAQGMSNGAAGLFQGMPVSTSLSQSSLNDSAGARTQMASIVTGGAVVLTLLLLAPFFSALPKPILAAIIIDAVVFGMMDVPQMRRLWRVKRIDFWIAIAAIVGVLSAGVLAGVVIGMVLSVGWLVYVNTLPAMTELGRQAGTAGFRPHRPDAAWETVPGLLIVRFDGGLTFVTSEGLAEGIRERCRSSDEPISGVVVDFVGVNFVDSQGADQLRRLVEVAAGDGASFCFARVRPEVMEVLRADGLVAELGEDHFHDDLEQAVAAERVRQA